MNQPQNHVPRPVRTRTRTGLRFLGPSTPPNELFSPNEARHDRIQARISARVLGSEDDLQALIDRWDDRDGIGSGLFRNSAAQKGQHWRLYTPRDRWLFSAQGKVYPIPGGLDVDLKINLNPTRFLAHQMNPSRAAIRELASLAALRLDPRRRTQLRDQALDGQDNVIVGIQYFSALEHHDEWWKEICGIYLAHIRNALTRELAPPPPHANVRLDYLRFSSPRLAEVYWELQYPAAQHWVMGVGKHTIRADAEASVTTYIRESRGNADVIGKVLTDNVKLKIYCKTPDRIRFEVEYSDTGRISAIASDRGKRPVSDFTDTIMGLRKDAAKRIQNFWRGIMGLQETKTESIGISQLVKALIEAAQSSNADPEAVINTLFANHRLAQTGPAGVAPEQLCQALKKSGILAQVRTRHGGTVQYALVPAYSDLVDTELGRGTPTAQ